MLESRALLGLEPAAAGAFGYTRGFQELREAWLLSMGTSCNIDIFELQFKIPPLQQPRVFQACGSELQTAQLSSLGSFWGGAVSLELKRGENFG